MQPPGNSADVIVVGLGAMGSATCWQLAARGVDVIGVDRHRPPHPYGSSHGETRITRLAIGEGPEYVPLVRRSHELWPMIESETNTHLVTQTGGLVIGPPAGAFLEQTRAVARHYGIEHTRLSHGDLVERFPMFTLNDELEAYFEPQSGYVRPERAIEAELDLARRHGAQLHFDERVDRWETTGEGLTVHTDRSTYYAQQLVLCVGPWLHELFPEARGPFAVYRQIVYWFPILSDYDQLRDMPIFIFDLGGERRGFTHLDGFYGFPAIDGRDGGVKVGTEQFLETTEPDDRQHPATQTEIDEMFERCVHPYIPQLGREPIRTVSCLYTSTRGNRFVIDRHPDNEALLIVSACSGHGFKHSPAIGEAIAQLLTNGDSEISLGAFALDALRSSD